MILYNARDYSSDMIIAICIVLKLMLKSIQTTNPLAPIVLLYVHL